MRILVVGAGNMAQETMRVASERRTVDCFPITETPDFEKGLFSNTSSQDTVAIHFGSGRLLPALIETC